MAQKPFKLKNPSEIMKMVEDPNITNLVNYIDKLHSLIKDYQIVIDTAVQKNRNVEP